MSLAIGGRASRRSPADLPGLIGAVAGKIVVVRKLQIQFIFPPRALPF
jgi:hypothetical protein